MIGQRLAQYVVQSRLGSGGMGEVYRARDTRLGRDVAIKILPPAFTSDQERLVRFEREAHVLASLNHPNIAAIYGLEEAEGVRALVLELVEGANLREHLAAHGTRLEVAEALSIARQIAAGLEAAHEKGIIHRDLKPANIQVTSNGLVKILDFGLAKAEITTPLASDSPTVTVAATRDGIILGTAAYMSPEQTRGRVVDKRSDIWAFGCVLYEMLTGTPAFTRESVSDTIAAILSSEPDWSQLPATVQPNIQKLLRRCLEKDSKRRLRDIADAGIEIDDALASKAQPSRPAGRSNLWRIAGSAALGGAAVAALIYFATRSTNRVASGPPQLTFRQITAAPGVEWFPSLSADGQWVVYSGEQTGNRDVYLQSVTGQNAINLTQDSSADDDQPAFSPDGQRIAFRSERDGGGIFVMGRTGEAVRRITRDGYRPAWSPDGRSLAYAVENIDINPQNGRGPGGIRIVNVESGDVRTFDNEAVQASWSPHGKSLALAIRQSDVRQADIVTIPVGGGERVLVVSGPAWDWNPAWSADGKYLYFSSDRAGTTNLWRIRVDESSGRPLGEPEPLTSPSTYAAHPSITGDGRHLAFSSVLITTNIAKLTMDPISGALQGRSVDVTSGSRPWANPDPSPDGQWVTFYSRLNPEGDVYISRTDGSGLRQLTGDPAVDRVPRWSPDGQWIIFFSTRSGELRIWGVHPDGSQLKEFTETNSTYPVWSPDSTRIAASSNILESKDRKVMIFDPRRAWKDQTPDVLPKFGSPEEHFVVTSWSPDGNTLVGQASFAATGVVTYSLQSKAFERLTKVGEWPTWLPDSRRILFTDGTGKYFYVIDSVTKEQKTVYTADREVLGGPRLSRDGRTVYFSRRVTQSDIWLMTIDQM